MASFALGENGNPKIQCNKVCFTNKKKLEKNDIERSINPNKKRCQSIDGSVKRQSLYGMDPG